MVELLQIHSKKAWKRPHSSASNLAACQNKATESLKEDSKIQILNNNMQSAHYLVKKY